MSDRLPPFLAGQQAFKDGALLNDNPHDRDAQFRPDEYPGDYQCWKEGWQHAYSVARHTRKMKRKQREAT